MERFMNDAGRFSESVMRQVVAIMGEAVREKIPQAVEIMRDEIKAFFFEDRWADARDCVMRRSMSDAWVINAVAAECADRITRA